MQEFMCPDGTMSVNQICRMFMSKADRDRLAGIVPKPDESLITGTKKVVESIERGAGTDIKNIPIPKKTFDQKYESIEDIPITKPAKGFNFDFEQVSNVKESADQMISSNMDYYNSFVQEKFGISPNVNTALRVGATAITGSFLPMLSPLFIGGALKAADNRRVQNITMQDTQGTLNTITSPRIMNIQPTARDTNMGGGGENRSYSSPAKTSQGVTSAQHQAFRM